jgi:transcriptional regulator with XRE-family HTH domain
VQKYEYGISRISAGRLSRIAELLQVPVSYFFHAVNGSDSPKVQSRTLDLLRPPGAFALLDHYSKIESPAHRRSVLEFARSLVGQEEDT